jgi:hypothetical protein
MDELNTADEPHTWEHWFAFAAKQGDADAQIKLGTMQENRGKIKQFGSGLIMNGAQYWYERAALQGAVEGQYLRGRLADRGGFHKVAARWFVRKLDCPRGAARTRQCRRRFAVVAGGSLSICGPQQ